MGTMGDEPIERPEREEARSGEAERAVKEVGSAKSARDADAAGKEGAEPYKPGSFEGGIVEFPSGDEPAVPPRKRLPLVLAIIGLVRSFSLPEHIGMRESIAILTYDVLLALGMLIIVYL